MEAHWRIPWPPQTTNHLHRVGRGKVYPGEGVLTYKIVVANRVRAGGQPVPPKGVPLKLTMLQHPPSGWHGDWDNSVKLPQDAVFAGLRRSDYWVDRAYVERLSTVDPADAGIDVTLEWEG